MLNCWKNSKKLTTKEDPLGNVKRFKVNERFVLYDSDLLELNQILSTIKNNKSFGIEEISSNIIENLPDEALTILVYLINQSFHTGIFSEELKTPVIVPLHKGGHPSEPCNYSTIPYSYDYENHRKTGESENNIFYRETQNY